MTLFNKLTSLAQKTKESASSRAILSKDKRLEQSWSDGLDPERMGVFKLATFGMPDMVSAVAFDPVAGLLAVGGGAEPHSTFVRIFGKGLAASLSLQTATAIKYLQFKTGSSLLVAVDKNNTIVVYDLTSRQARHTITAPAIVTCIEYCTGTDWLFVGLADGNVHVFDLATGTFANYGVADLNPSAHSATHMVVSLRMHPTDLNLLLIGYETGVFLWSIREQTPKRQFLLNTKAQLTCMAWSPCGNRFTVGCDDGVMHFWDVRSDSRPFLSRRVFQPYPVDADQDLPCEPIYQLSWHVIDNKSCLVVAGGSEFPEMHGLYVMEFDLEGEMREARMQTMLATAVEVADYILLPRDPFDTMDNPHGVLIIGCDGSISAHGLDRGFPSLTLPPALAILHPRLQDAIHFTELESQIFQKINHNPLQSSARYLPLTGGAAGDAHVYKIPSNDLMITLHAGNVLKFWDASFTSLRPLPHLTMRCDQAAQASVTAVTLDRQSANLYVTFDSGVIVVYMLQELQTPPPPVPTPAPDTEASASLSTHEQLAAKSHSTIKELEDIMNDIQEPTEGEPSSPPQSKPLDNQQDTACSPSSGGGSTPNSQSPVKLNEPSMGPISIETLHTEKDATGYVAYLKLVLRNNSAIQYTATHNHILAFTTKEGDLFAVDTISTKLILATQVHPRQVKCDDQTKAPYEQQEKESMSADKAATEVISATCLKLYSSYSTSKLTETALQLYVGLSNGVVNQYELTAPSPSPSVKITTHQGAIVDISLANLQGQLPCETPEQDARASNDAQSRKSLDVSVPREAGVASPTEKPRSLLRKTTRKFSRSSRSQPAVSQTSPPPLPQHPGSHSVSDEPVELPAPPSSPDSTNTGSGSPTQPTRPSTARGEYKPQRDPHLLISVSTTSIYVTLNGYNTKLFQTGLQDINAKDDMYVHGQVANTEAGSCLITILKSGLVVIYTLPSLTPVTTFMFPNSDQIQRISQSHDGRITAWTGKYELQQFIILLQNNIPCGEAVLLDNPHMVMPPRPLSRPQTQKKSWIDTMQSAFQKSPLTVPELDSIMGRTPDKKPETKQNGSTDKTKKSRGDKAKSGSSGPGNVFTELGVKMNERGERINELGQKFSELHDASGDFLRAIKEYNERQARKKWYEF